MRTALYLSAITLMAGSAGSGALVPGAQAQGMRAIYSFGPPPDGAQPNGGLVRDSVGRLLGVTAAGGAYRYGTVYRLTHQNNNQWTEEILHSFNKTDGRAPVGELIVDPSGTIFGATGAGGPNDTGTVYRLDNVNGTWAVTTLHAFGEVGGTQDLNFPTNGVSFGPNGLLYGTAEEAGAGGLGGVFSVSPNLDQPDGYAIIVAFSRQFGPDDGDPVSPLIVTDHGHLMGLENNYAQAPDNGIAFDLFQTRQGSWKDSVAYRFQGPPNDAVIFPGTSTIVKGMNGRLVGCGYGGQFSQGVVYTLTVPSIKGSPWIETILYNFGAHADDPAVEGLCGVTAAPDGSVFGTTGEGGLYGLGTIFHLTPPSSGTGPWQNTTLHSFAKGGQDGRVPLAGLLRVGQNYYGIASQSGHNGPGVVFVIRP